MRTHTAASVTSNGSTNGSSESVKVIVRCRPLSSTEIKQGHNEIVSLDVSRGVIDITNPKDPTQPAKSFIFDAIYDSMSKQIDLYDESFRELVNSVLCGFNGTIFAYGQTGTGKTFTMEGIQGDLELRGVIPNAIYHIFDHISKSNHQQFLVRASYLEIYQEEIRDLLDSKDAKKRLELKERSDIGVYVKDLSSFVTKSVKEVEHLLNIGHSNRSVGCTNMNEHSSRSHAIFILTVECSEQGSDGENHIRVGRLNLVDLAGSERQLKTGTQGKRFKEAIKINLSLSALGNVISALIDKKSNHIPYRDSKLTRLLQDSLGGNSKTVMIANIGPASYNYEETMSTLRYANRAKNILNKPKINEDPKDALLREFQDEIIRLKSLLEKRLNTPQRSKHQSKSISQNEKHKKDIDELALNNYSKEQQLFLENERKELLKSTSIVEVEKRKMLMELEDRANKLEKERESQFSVAAKIRTMQSKLLSGDNNLLDQTRQQQEMLQKKRIELAEQKKREREISQRLELQEDSTTEIRQTFANFQQEVEAKTQKFKKFLNKLQQIRFEICDIVESNARERESLATSLSEINKELKLKYSNFQCLLIENFIPIDFVQKVKSNAIFDSDEEKWLISNQAIKNSLLQNESTNYNSKLNYAYQKPEMIDSGLESNSESAIVVVSKSINNCKVDNIPDLTIDQKSSSSFFDVNKKNFCNESLLKRPVSSSGICRPTCNYEKTLLLSLHKRMQQSLTNDFFYLNSSSISKFESKRNSSSLLSFQTVLQPPLLQSLLPSKNVCARSVLGKEINLYPEPVQPLNCYQQMKQQTQSIKRMNMDLKTSAKTQNLIYTQSQEMTSNINSLIPPAMPLIPLNENRKNSQIHGVMFPKVRGLVISGEIAGSRRSADHGGFGLGINKKKF